MYLVTSLTWPTAWPWWRPGDPGYATSARELTSIEVAAELRARRWGAAQVHFGDVQVTRQVTSFVRRQLETGQPAGRRRSTCRRAPCGPGRCGGRSRRPARRAGGPRRRPGRCRARRRARLDRAAAAGRRVRSLGRRRRLRRPASGHRAADRVRLRRARRRGRVCRARLPGGRRLARAPPPGRSSPASAARAARPASSRPSAATATSRCPSSGAVRPAGPACCRAGTPSRRQNASGETAREAGATPAGGESGGRRAVRLRGGRAGPSPRKAYA